MAKVLIKSSKPNKACIKNLYDLCNKIFTSGNLFYTSEQIEDLKLNKNNIFLK